MGYLTAAERLALTPPTADSTVTTFSGFVARSFVSTWTVNRRDVVEKWYLAGSISKRPSRGYVYLDMSYKQYKDGRLVSIEDPPPWHHPRADSIVLDWHGKYNEGTTKFHVVSAEHAFEFPHQPPFVNTGAAVEW
uniref:Uncharacterized protein n=1 Tax=candidate division WOR-3 bacterium TaxID=2052148 RepID=A0A7C4CAC3_UNCW3